MAMATSVIPNLTGTLDEELVKARDTLKEVDESIRKLFGKDAKELTTFGRGRRGLPEDSKEGYDKGIATNGRTIRESRVRRGEESYPDEPWEKRRRNHDSSSAGGRPNIRDRFNKEDAPISGGAGDLRGRLQSRIVTSMKEKSRDEVLAEQREDRSGLTRNRRMFGALLGTLQRFKQDETKLKEKEDKRAQIEAKLDEAAKNEREGVRKEKQQLIRDRKFKMTEIRRLEVKKTRLEELEQWEIKTKYLSNFIRTETKPHIFYLPKVMNPVMDCRLEQSKQLVAEMIAAKRKECLEDLGKYEQKSKRYWEQRLGRREKRLSTEQFDVDMEEELKEVMRTDEVTHLPEGEDITVTVSTLKDEPESDNDDNDGPERNHEFMDDENESVSHAEEHQATPTSLQEGEDQDQESGMSD